jgi:hypothetical protein
MTSLAVSMQKEPHAKTAKDAKEGTEPPFERQLQLAPQPGGLPEGSRWSFGGKGGETTTGTLPKTERIPEGCQNRNPAERLLVWHPCRGANHLPTPFPVVVPPFPRPTTGYRLASLQDASL